MAKNKPIIVYFIIGLLLHTAAMAQFGNNFEVTRFRLPNETTTAGILEDQFGFVWIASTSGLWRYDGGNFKNYKRDPKDSTSITDNFISCLYEDKSGTLWVGTYGGGLLKYDRDCDCFQRFIHRPNDPTSLSFNEIKVIFETSDNKFYVGTDGGGLNIMDRTDNTFQHFKHQPGDSSTLSHNNVLAIEEAPNGNLYVGTWLGFNIFYPSRGNFKRIYQKFHPKNQYFFNIELFNNRLFTSGDPASYLNQYEELEQLGAPIHYANKLAKDKEGRCWFSGSNGISIINSKFQLEQLIPIGSFYQNGEYGGLDGIWSSHQANTTWVLGTNGNFFMVEEKSKIFKPFLTNQNVREIVLTDSNYWAITGNTISIFDKETHDVDKTISGFEGAVHMASRERNRVWVVDQQNYYEYTSRGKRISTTPHHTNTSINTLEPTMNNQVWTGKILGANRFDPVTGKITRFNCDPNIEKGIGYFHRASKIFQDHLGQIWIGTDGDGLKRFVPESEEFQHFRHTIGDTTTINSNFVNDIFEDNQFNLWLGTNTGLCRLHQESNTFIQYNFEELQDKSVYSIEQDYQGNLWIGTFNGLIKLDYKNNDIRMLNRQDGILSDKIGSASLRLDDGRLVFCTSNGPMLFQPNDVKPSDKQPTVFISELWVNNELVRPRNSDYISRNIEVEDAINLNYTDKKFELHFQVIHYNNNERCEYSYKLNGFDKSWIGVNNTPKATYTNIPPGQYTFMVKASNEDGIWNDKVTTVDIRIAPPFWDILWVKILGITILGLVFFLIIRQIIARERTKTKFEIEKARVRQAEEITQMKLRFFTNISHELRTPLTLITSPLDKYIRNNVVPKPNVLDMMYKNSRRLLELVNQILDFRKLENNQQQLKIVPQKNLLLFQNIYAAYSYWSNDKNIDFTIELPKENYITYFDADVIEKIVSNLVSNAFKFTPEFGRIELNISFEDIKNRDDMVTGGKMVMRISDTGPGIPRKVQAKIFERFYQMDDTTMASHGSGIGLSLTSELVQLHHGKIELISGEGEGTHFKVEIPIGLEDYPEGERKEHTVIYPEIDPKSTMILIVEDHEDIRNYLVEELNEVYEVLEAEDGKAGLQKALAAIPDIIISDVMMPEINGIQLANQLKNNELTAHIPILFLSAKGSTEHKLEGLATGAEDYIQKPFNIQEIKLKIRNLLETRNLLIEKFKRENVEVEPPSAENKYLSKVNAVISNNLDNSQFSVDILCTELAVGRSQLYRKILALTGKSIIEYINSYRLSKAMELIKQENYSLKEIAYKVGYNDNHYFSRSFKKEFGQSPSFYTPKREKSHK